MSEIDTLKRTISLEAAIESKLELLADLRHAREQVQGRIEQLHEDAIPNEVQEEVARLRGRILELERPHRERVARICADTEADLEAMAADIADLEDEVKRLATSLGHSVKGRSLQAVYTKGRASWDDKALQGYGAAHPEILAFRKEGAPSVSLRAVNGK